MTHLDTINDLIADWTQRDVDAVVDRVADNITFYYAAGQAPIVGKASFRKFLSGMKDQQKDLDWRIKRSAETDDFIMTEGVDDYINAAGHHVQTPHMTIFEFTDGKISGWRDYFNFGLLMRTEKGEPLSEHALSLINL